MEKFMQSMIVDADLIEKEHSGLMVALYVPEDQAKWLALDGGEPAQDLHVTLAYVPGIGKNREALDAVKAAVERVARKYGPVHGWIGGSGRFNGSETSDFKDVFYASFDAPVLSELRQEVCDAIEETGFTPSYKHGFCPHVTLKYLGMDEGTPLRRPASMPFDIPHISVVGGAKREDVGLTGDHVVKEQPGPGSVHVPTAGSEKRPKKAEDTVRPVKDDDATVNTVGDPAVNPNPDAPETEGWDVTPETNLGVRVGKEDGDEELAQAALDSELADDAILAMCSVAAVFEKRLAEAIGEDAGIKKAVPIAKIAPEKQIVYGVVLEPDYFDAQGDMMTAEEIEKTAHKYMESVRKVGRRHTGLVDATPVESFIAPQEMRFEGGPYGTQVVKKGSWVLGVKVNDPVQWEKVKKGEYRAFSVGGFGCRTPA